MNNVWKRTLALLLAVLCCFTLLSGCGNKKQNDTPLPDASNPTEIVTDSGETVTVTEPVAADSYDTLYAALIGVQQAASQIYALSEQAAIPEEQLVNPEAEAYGDPDYAAANLPAAGVTQGDLIVTDGTYIYMVCASELVIVSASGADTREVGRTFVTNPAPEGYGGSETPQALYLSGDNLYVITYEYLYSYAQDSGRASAEKVHVKQYSVADRTKPAIVADFAQSGRYLTSYCADDVLYLVGAHSIWTPDKADPATFVPSLTQNGEDALLEAGDIYLCPGLDSTDYTVVTALRLGDGSRLATKALTGYNAWSAADGQNLYLARTSYTYTMSDPYDKDQYSVTDFTYNAFTRLVRLSMDGTLSLGASGTVEGYLFNQGAMSLKDGTLYLGTVCNGYAYQVYTDEKYGFVNYQMGERTATNAAYALSSDLETLRSVRDTAGGDTVYAIRFTGSTAYVMTYDDLIPKYVIDMTADSPKPAAVQGLDSMAHNLYYFGEGRTAGVGVSAAEDGTVTGLTLTVYDTSGTNVTPLSSVTVSDQWSQAMNNPTAVRVFPEQQLIAVPTDTGYQVYAMQDGTLTAKGSVELGYVSAGTRVFSIGDCWYFCNDATVVAANAGDLTPVAKCDFAYG